MKSSGNDTKSKKKSKHVKNFLDCYENHKRASKSTFIVYITNSNARGFFFVQYMQWFRRVSKRVRVLDKFCPAKHYPRLKYTNLTRVYKCCFCQIVVEIWTKVLKNSEIVKILWILRYILYLITIADITLG